MGHAPLSTGIHEDRPQDRADTRCPAGSERNAYQHTPCVPKRLVLDVNPTFLGQCSKAEDTEQVEAEENDEHSTETLQPHLVELKQAADAAGGGPEH